MSISKGRIVTLTSLTYFLHSYIISLHPESVKVQILLMHLSTYTSTVLFKLSQQIRQEFCSRQLHLSKLNSFQKGSAQSKVSTMWGEEEGKKKKCSMIHLQE